MGSFCNYEIKDFENESREVSFFVAREYIYVFPHFIFKSMKIYQLNIEYTKDGSNSV